MPWLTEREVVYILDLSLPAVAESDARAQHTGTTRTFSWIDLAWPRCPLGPWQPQVPESHRRWRASSRKSLSASARVAPSPLQDQAPTITPLLVRLIDCLVTEPELPGHRTDCFIVSSADLVAGSENLFSRTKLITVGCRSPGVSPNPHQLAHSRVFPSPLKPLSSVCPFLASSFPPTAGIGLRWEIDRQVLAQTPHRSLWKCLEDGARPPASCWKGTDREGSSEVLSASSPLANLDVVRVFLERGIAVESLLEENCSIKAALTLISIGNISPLTACKELGINLIFLGQNVIIFLDEFSLSFLVS